jgi:hypothetical protein
MPSKKQFEILYLAFLFVIGYFLLSVRVYGFLLSRLPAPVHWLIAVADTVFAVRHFLSYAKPPTKAIATNAPSPNTALKMRRFAFMPYRAPTPPRSHTD